MKKIFNIFLYFVFIILCLLLINTKSSAYTLTTNQQLLLDYYENNLKSTYDSLIITANNYLIVWNQPQTQNRFWLVTDINFLQCEQEDDITTLTYYCNDGVNVVYWTDVIKFGYGQGHHQISGGASGFVISSVNIYSGAYNHSYFDNNIFPQNYFNNRSASIINTTTQAYQDNLVNGSFEYLIVDAGDYAQYPVILHINNGSISIDSPGKYKYIVLDHNSPYADLSIEPNQYQSWTIPKADLIPFYNNTVYNIWLTYGENHALSTSTYTWTTNFSQSTIDNAVVDEQDATHQVAENTQQIANELGQTNQFLTSDNIDDNDIELPEISANDFTLTFFSTLVGGITDAFLNTSYDEYIEFDVRNTHYVIHSTEFNILSRVGLSALKNFVSLFWIFGIGYWIYCDARRRIALLKEFHWTAMFADDISVDML